MEKVELKQIPEGYELIIDGNPYLNLIKIPEDSFTREDGKNIKVSSFYMGQFPVTQELYEAVTGKNPSNFKGIRHPVESVTWYDSVRFCAVLNLELVRSGFIKDTGQEKLISYSEKQLDSFHPDPKAPGFRLPTEAEWEFAARGKSENAAKEYAGSDMLDLVGWYEKNNDYETKPVGLKFPNSNGLYDMSGNVWEWCWDWYGEYDKGMTENPVGPKTGSSRILRGGSWIISAGNCRTGDRISGNPGDRIDE